MWSWIQKIIDWFKKAKPELPPITPEPEPDEDTDNALPKNPATGPDVPNSISEHWSFGAKEHDQTWRVRWPSYFARQGIGSSSYCTVNGFKAHFRSYDVDHGSKRPSYTMPLSIGLVAPITCILYDNSGVAIGWFKCNGLSGKDRLPDQG